MAGGRGRSAAVRQGRRGAGDLDGRARRATSVVRRVPGLLRRQLTRPGWPGVHPQRVMRFRPKSPAESARVSYMSINARREERIAIADVVRTGYEEPPL